MKRSKSYFIIALLLLFTQTVLAEQTYTPQEKIVRQLYHDFSWQALMDSPSNDLLYYQPISTLKNYFDSNLANLIEKDAACAKKTHGECNLSFDPIFDSQDPSILAIDISQSEKSNEVTVEFNHNQSGIKNYHITYKLIQINNIWRISDIIYSNGYTLTKILNNKS